MKNMTNAPSSANARDRKNHSGGLSDVTEKRKRLYEIEAAMDKRAADIALTVSNMFKFMAMSAAILPNMELDTGIMRLKIDDGGILFAINDPFRIRKDKCANDNCDEEPDDDFEDDYDEEGLLYDGD